MTTKITLKIDSGIADRVKQYARKRKMSVDKMMEKQMAELLQLEEVLPAVKELAGILEGVKVKDARVEFRSHQLNKHSL